MPAVWRIPLAPGECRSAANGSAIGAGVNLYFDGSETLVSWRQKVIAERQEVPGYALVVESGDFDGSYISVAIEVPNRLLRTVTRNSIVRLEMKFRSDRPIDGKFRLNLRRGPNIFAIWQPFDSNVGGQQIDFDLADSGTDPTKTEAMWLDLVVSVSRAPQIELADVRISHRFRAEF